MGKNNVEAGAEYEEEEKEEKGGEGVSTKRRSGREDIAETSGDWIRVGEGEEGKKGRR